MGKQINNRKLVRKINSTNYLKENSYSKDLRKQQITQDLIKMYLIFDKWSKDKRI